MVYKYVSYPLKDTFALCREPIEFAWSINPKPKAYDIEEKQPFVSVETR